MRSSRSRPNAGVTRGGGVSDRIGLRVIGRTTAGWAMLPGPREGCRGGGGAGEIASGEIAAGGGGVAAGTTAKGVAAGPATSGDGTRGAGWSGVGQRVVTLPGRVT